MRFGLSAALGVALAAVLAWPSAPASAQQAGDMRERSREAREARPADPCSAAEMRRLVRETGASVDEREAKVMSEWCRKWETRDRAATTAVAAATPAPTKALQIDRIGTQPPEPAIWCTKSFCTCFKGKKYDGCVHTDKVCLSGSVKCGPLGHVCGCKAG